MTESAARIRAAEEQDVPTILELIRELARYEREPDAVLTTEQDLRSALFDPAPRVYAHVAEVDGDGVVGIAVWYTTWSTWTGRHGIWLEDLVVSARHRGLGLGRDLVAALAGVCAERGWARLEWNVLDWNEPALSFYRALGASRLDDWTVHRVCDQALVDLATRRKV